LPGMRLWAVAWTLIRFSHGHSLREKAPIGNCYCTINGNLSI
jgi:hypothetical protein